MLGFTVRSIFLASVSSLLALARDSIVTAAGEAVACDRDLLISSVVLSCIRNYTYVSFESMNRPAI